MSGGKVMMSSEIIKILENDGWYWIKTVGSHHHFKHPTKPGEDNCKASPKGRSTQDIQ